MHALDDLNEKVDVLLRKYAALETENKRLRETVAKHTKVEDELRTKIESLEQNMVSVHLGKTDISEDEKQNMRAQLDTVITEIDKILNTLND